MALENFTGYSTWGAQIGDVTIGANMIETNPASTEQDAGMVYADKGAGHFTNSFTHYLRTRAATIGGAYNLTCWAVSNNVTEGTQDWLTNAREAVALCWQSGGGDEELHLRECEDAASDLSAGCDEDTWYWPKVVRSGAQGKTFTVYIYNDDARTSLVDTITVDVTDADQTYRYIVPLNLRDEAGGTNEVTDYDAGELDLDEAAGGMLTYTGISVDAGLLYDESSTVASTAAIADFAEVTVEGAGTVASTAAIADWAEVTVEGAGTVASTLAITTAAEVIGGGTVYNEDCTIASTLAVADTMAGTIEGAAAVAATLAIASSAEATVEGSATVAATNAFAPIGNIVYPLDSTIGSTLAITTEAVGAAVAQYSVLRVTSPGHTLRVRDEGALRVTALSTTLRVRTT